MNRPRLAAVTFLLGLGLVFLIELDVARIVGVPLIFIGIALGVGAIATPEFLSADRGSEPEDPGSAPADRG